MEPVIAVSIIIAVSLLSVFMFFQFAKFIYHWLKVLNNITNKYSPLLGPLILLRKSNFNEAGQEHLAKSAYHFRRFIYSAIPFVALGILGKLVK